MNVYTTVITRTWCTAASAIKSGAIGISRVGTNRMTGIWR